MNADIILSCLYGFLVGALASAAVGAVYLAGFWLYLSNHNRRGE